MPKHVMTINPVCIVDGYNLGEIIYEKLNSVSSGWSIITEITETNQYDNIFRKTEKNPEYCYGFRVDKWKGKINGGISVMPCLYTLSGDTITNFSSIWTASIYASEKDPEYTNTVLSDLTIFIGKQRKCYSVSVTPHDAGYVLMSSICGEDSNGDPYIFYPGIRADGDGGAMAFKINDFNEPGSYIKKNVNTKYVSYVYPDDQGMGMFGNNQTLVMSPFVNPHTGSICTDLYMPICGPATTRIYDVAIGSRRFCTGSSNAPSQIINPIAEYNYQAYYKVFMEV